ncbi:MAG: hypothetical protein K8F34_02975, partial [Candidatus Kuenenia stuttgartiensis]|nr:hypothetical protein [Candidatus Kuenenia stuttgartiensis]
VWNLISKNIQREYMSNSENEQEVLVVISKLKNYIRSTAGMNTAGNVASKLSGIVRNLCDQAIENAKSDGRKTVMEKDFS